MAGLLSAIPGGEASNNAAQVSAVSPSVSVALNDSGGRTPQENSVIIPPIIGYVQERFQRALTSKRPYEQLNLDAHRNYRGLYGPETAFTATEKSRVFIRVTKTKVVAAYGSVMDVLFANNQFPIAVEPEKLPEGVQDVQSIETDPNAKEALPKGPQTKTGYVGDGTRPDEKSSVAAKAFIGEVAPSETIYDGPPIDATSVEIDAPLLSAKKMQKKIQDQLKESNADKHLRHAVFESVCFGTGCIKGPIAVTTSTTELDEQGQPTTKDEKHPRIEAVSIWNIYPDPDARSVEECDFIIQRHKLSTSQLRGLKRRPGFRPNEIEELIGRGFNYVRQWFEPMLKDMPVIQTPEKFEVLEFWGTLDRALAERFGLDNKDITDNFGDVDEVPVNIWISGNSILRFVLNPFNNGRIPYYLVPYEIQPYTIWGIGVAESMSDAQMLINGFTRLAVDNAVLAGNLVFEIDESTLVPGQGYDLYPGKVFRKQGGQQGQSIYSHTFPDVVKSNIAMYDKARELADEATFPSFTHGNTGVNPSLGRTSSGLSMLMGAASVGTRQAISNWDDYCLAPLAQAIFEFNKINSDDDELKGNFVIMSGGTNLLMKTEVRSQRLISLVNILMNPALAPFAKWPYLLREVFDSLDIDSDKALNNNAEAVRMAALLKQMMPQQGQQNTGQIANSGNEPAVGNPQAGQVNLPGEQGFSANKNPTPPTHASPSRGVS